MNDMKSEQRCFWIELDELRQRMVNANDLAWTLSHALECGQASAKSYVGSALAIYEYQDTLLGEMENIIDAMIEETKKEKVSA